MKDAFSAETLALIEEKIPDNLGSDWLSDLWLSFSPTFEVLLLLLVDNIVQQVA